MLVPEENEGTIPQRVTSCSILIYVNIFSIEVGVETMG